MKLEAIGSGGPEIVKTMFRPAAIYIKFPSGDVWEYVVYDDAILRQLLRSHRKNVGRLVKELRRFDSQKVKDGNQSTAPAQAPKRQQQLF